MFFLECNYCGKEVQRVNDIKTATCYDCRLKQRQERARKYQAQIKGKYKQYVSSKLTNSIN